MFGAVIAPPALALCIASPAAPQELVPGATAAADAGAAGLEKIVVIACNREDGAASIDRTFGTADQVSVAIGRPRETLIQGTIRFK